MPWSKTCVHSAPAAWKQVDFSFYHAAGGLYRQWLLLAIRGLPDAVDATIRVLADRLVLKHHSVVELVDRLEQGGLVRRSRGRDDRRRVLVSLLPRGEKLLEEVARHRIGELRSSGAALVAAIEALLESTRHSSNGQRAKKTSKRKKR